MLLKFSGVHKSPEDLLDMDYKMTWIVALKSQLFLDQDCNFIYDKRLEEIFYQKWKLFKYVTKQMPKEYKNFSNSINNPLIQNLENYKYLSSGDTTQFKHHACIILKDFQIYDKNHQALV